MNPCWRKGVWVEAGWQEMVGYEWYGEFLLLNALGEILGMQRSAVISR